MMLALVTRLRLRQGNIQPRRTRASSTLMLLRRVSHTLAYATACLECTTLASHQTSCRGNSCRAVELVFNCQPPAQRPKQRSGLGSLGSYRTHMMAHKPLVPRPCCWRSYVAQTSLVPILVIARCLSYALKAFSPFSFGSYSRQSLVAMMREDQCRCSGCMALVTRTHVMSSGKPRSAQHLFVTVTSLFSGVMASLTTCGMRKSSGWWSAAVVARTARCRTVGSFNRQQALLWMLP